MQSVISTVFEQHDLRLVALAALVCSLSAFAGITLLIHARRTEGPMKKVWLAVAAVSVGFGIWATHFVAMLAFHAGMPVGYDLPVTVLSLAIAIAIVGGGLWFAAIGPRPMDAVLGGAVVGIGIASMHYTGMAALLIGGGIVWHSPLVAASVLFGMAFGAGALYFAVRGHTLRRRLRATVLLTLAICAMHFTAMGAAGLENCFPVVAANDATPQWLSIVVALVSVMILLFAVGGTYLDMLDRRRTAAEGDRMRGLADAAVEGLVVAKNGIIVTANQSFLKLIEAPEADVQGRPLADFLGTAVCNALDERPNAPIETDLRAAFGVVPAEVILRHVDFAGAPHQAIAVRDLSARKQAEQHIRFLAHHDALTGLPNRVSFARKLADEIAHARRHEQTFAVMCLDLDRFKEVNDLFGHAAGDTLLQRVGQALLGTIEGVGYAARLSGDEFAVLLPDIGTPARAGRVAEQILDAFRRDNDMSTSGAMISGSIGIALFPDNADTDEQLMTHADTALYRAKQDGRGIYRFFESAMGAEVRDRRMLEHDLRHAVSRNQLRLVYQPQVDIQSDEVTGFEALVRWTHPERGEISPGVFVPVAEESGLILQIGEWVLRTACAEAARWKVPLSVAVNVSAVQIHSPTFAQTVHEVLLQTGLDPTRLEVEITESALIRDMARAITTLRQIRALGVRIAMDDFGTGYSSLANLRAFPFSKIKVDQSFIRSVDNNMQSAAIVRAVLGLGSGLNVPVVAEGVERPEELEFLRGEVCQTAQGYLLSKPKDIRHFESLTEGKTRTLDAAAQSVPMKAVG
ncbi:EAL domain-containing protein [Devosia sp. ZB163]|uniref:bifunctional diguanylate cyclase/phosphodiesterase n=1 Tax=Devosia sp. ZB163 TaxID=3025938 RepID=UPI002362CA14|nr:EAL domain-containing protein [Devosia sp. ZB163]MDC9823244.1 EAL domain-containing protein [Devosia sp. ZB163]